MVVRYVAVLGAIGLASALALPVPAPAVAQSQSRSADGVDIAPHRAVYVLGLGRSRQGSNVTGARGALVMEWEKSCAGWTVKQRLQLDLTNNDGTTVSTESNFSSFESLDGLKYRFTSRDTQAGRVLEDIEGSATLTAPGAGGHAEFSRPEGRRFDLPAGTMFPTQHIIALIEAGRRGERVLYRPVFDGASLDGPIAVNAVIGRPAAKPTGAAAREPLTNRASWRLRLAFFPLKDSKAEPNYELGFRLFDNGVADSYEIDYGSFSVDAALERVEALERPRC